MYTVDELYKMMNEGKSAEELAQAFTDALNGAMDRRREEENAQQALQEQKIEKTWDIIEDILMYLEDYYPELEVKWEPTEEDVKAFIAAMDNVMNSERFKRELAVLRAMQQIVDQPTVKVTQKIASNDEDKNKKILNIDDIFGEFFAKNGL